MSGVSAVPGSPSGSSAHWKAWWIAVRELPPASFQIRAAIQLAPGATPIEVPPASPPTITPIVPVPCPVRSVGIVVCWPYGSYQSPGVPRNAAARSGCVASTPLSRLATTTPLPSAPDVHTVGAPMDWMFASGIAAGVTATASGRIEATSGLVASWRITRGVAATETAFAIQSGVARPARPADRAAPSVAIRSARAVSATSRRVATTARRPRATVGVPRSVTMTWSRRSAGVVESVCSMSRESSARRGRDTCERAPAAGSVVPRMDSRTRTEAVLSALLTSPSP